jgi:tetratricopeptide (TPR) repeat protein
VRRLEVAEDGARASLVTRSWDARGELASTRWTLVRDGVRWRVLDMEDVTTGMSMSLGAGLAVAAVRNEAAAELLRRFRIVQRAFDELAQGEAESAGGLVRDLDVDGLPNLLRASRQLILGAVEMARGRPARALPRYERAAEIEPRSPITDYLRAAALNALGRHEEALPLARSFLKRVGPDAYGYAESSMALGGLGRREEALAAARKGLEDDPGSPESLFALAAQLPAEERVELTNRLLAQEDPVLAAVDLIPDLIRAGHLDAANAVVLAIRRASPRDPEADYWEALVEMERGRFEEAARLLQRALPRVGDAEDLAAFQEAYLEAQLALGRPVQGYAAFPGSSHAFELLADELLAKGDGKALGDLVAAHRKYAAADPWLPYFSGSALELLGRHGQAEAVYAAGMKAQSDAAILEELRAARVRNLLAAGKPMEAYARVGPRRRTFDQLAEAAVWEGDVHTLEILVRAHRVQDGADPSLPLWEAEAQALGGRLQDAVELLVRNRELIRSGRLGPGQVQDRLVRFQTRLGHYGDALVEAQAFTAREGNPYLEGVVHAWTGAVEPLVAVIEACLERGWRIEDFYDDEDIGVRIRTPGFRSLRERYPDPDAQQR